MFSFVFNIYKVIYIYITVNIYICFYNSLIFVMSYKIYNEMPGVGTGANL